MTHEFIPMVEPDRLATTLLRRGEVVSQNNPVFQIVLEDLRQRIQRGEWLPGTRLPSIMQLAKDLNVSTGSVREALRSLQSSGIVKIEHGRGVFVMHTHHLMEPSGAPATANIELIMALAEARRLLEPEFAALAAERATDSELQLIELLARQMEALAKQGADFVTSDVQFHRLIAQAAHNPILDHMMSSLQDVALISRRIVVLDADKMARTARYHMLIVDALRDRNAGQARLLMLAHMNDMQGDIIAAAHRVKGSES